MKTNIKERIVKKVDELGCVLCCYDKSLDEVLTRPALKKVLNNLDQEYTDVFLNIKKELYVVEIATVNNEKDIRLFKAVDYFRQYGNLEEALDNGDITQTQYNKINKIIY